MKLQTARKNHLCDLCQRQILKGEKYWRHYNSADVSLNATEHTNCELFNDKEHDPE